MKVSQFHGITPKHYQALFQISHLINSLSPTATLLNRIMDLALEALNARRGFIVFYDAQTKKFNVQVARQIKSRDIDDLIQVSNSVLWQVVKSWKPLLTIDAQSDPRFSNSQSIMIADVRSVLAVPLAIKDELQGVIYVDSDQQRGEFNQEALYFLNFFAQQAAITIENSRLYQQLQQENQQLRAQVKKVVAEEFIGQHPLIQKIMELVVKVAPSDAPVLIEGESGTGKEVLARIIHNLSNRKDKPFLVQYCSALADTLLESELFGHKKGAFTGAVSDKPGLLEMADKGTFLLDELADLHPNTQANLLRVVQNGEIKRVGDTRVNHIDVRFLSATNKNVAKEVQAGRFREDLYFRLNVVSIRIPPLWERRSDIPLLAKHFLRKHQALNVTSVQEFSDRALQKLTDYYWPGNIRELENVIHRALLLAEKSELQERDIIFSGQKMHDKIKPGTLEDIEREIVLHTLEELNGNRTRTAQRLGVSLRWLQYRLKEWGSKDTEKGA